jgi:uncharacterized protein (DUF305 family)
MTTRRKTAIAVLVALVAGAAIATATGCGSSHDDDHGMSTGMHSMSDNRTDAAFVTDMIPHHQGAIDMARIALTRAEHPELKRLATSIIADQRAEIGQMREMGGMHAGSAHMEMDEHMMGMDMDLPALRRARPFDRAFIEAMIPHHQGAIRMARMELATGKDGETQALAKRIIAAQTKEIAQMRAWLRDWYGKSA